MTTRTANRLPVSRYWKAVITVMAAAILAMPSDTSTAQQTKPLEPRSANAREYSACMALARRNPTAAHGSALAWRKKGGGDAALHCVAVALLGLGQYKQAGQMMEELADRTDHNRAVLKAGLLGQAANAWLIANQPARTENLLSKALKLLPRDVEILLDRSVARAAMGNYWDALDDLNDALEQEPNRADALTFRASAWRHVDALELAEVDIEAALKKNPDFLDGLLERGLIRKARGNRAGARADWQRVLEIAVDGPFTEAARRYLEDMDVKKR